MKKNLNNLGFTAILSMIFILGAIGVAFAATGNDVNLKVDGKLITTDVSPAIVDSRTLVPARAVFEAVGGKVSWDDKTPSDIGISCDGKSVQLKIGSKTAIVDGAETTMDVPAQLFPGDRTLIPVRFVAESLGFFVDWENNSRTVIINSNGEGQPIVPQEPTKPTSGKVQKVTFGLSGNKHRITVSTDKPIEKYLPVALESPHRYYIDLPGYELSAPIDFLTGDATSVVTQVRASLFEKETVRIVADLRTASKPTISLSGDKKTIYLDFDKYKFNPFDDGKLVVMLDPGHGSNTGGKRSFDGSLMEYEFNRDVARRLKAVLEQQGVQVLMTTKDDFDTSLKDRCLAANNSDADIFVSIHANAFGTDWNKVNGWEAYVYKTGGLAEALGKEIERIAPSSLGLTNRGVKPSDYYVVKYTDVPAVLIEHGFYTNKEEVEKLKSDSFRQKCAESDAKGIMNFLNKYK